MKKKTQIIIILLVLLVIITFYVLNKISNNDMEKHIERVSQECAEKGYGIEANYTNQGDKFYICKK